MENPPFNLAELLHDQGFIAVPMNKLSSGHLQLNASLNGIAGSWVLDTGAGGTVIDPVGKETFHLEVESTEDTASGAGGTGLRMELSNENVMNLEGLVMTDVQLVVMSLDHVNGAFEKLGIERVDGVIGADILSRGQAVIDYATLTLFLKDEQD